MSPPDDPPVVQQALQIAQQAQADTQPLVRASLTQPKEPSVASVMTRGQPIPPHAPDPTPAARDAARADTRTGANHVNQRLDTIVPPSERVAGGVYKAGAPGGGRWADLPASVLQRKGLGFRKRVPAMAADPNAPPVPLPPRNHNQPPGPLPMAPTPGLGAAQAEPTPEPSDDDHLRRIWKEAVDESSAAAKHAVATHNVRPTFTADDWHSALSLPFMDHLWYELSGEKLAENLPGLTHSEHMKMLDVLGATSARAKPDENLERTLAVMSQHMRGVPIDTDLTIPSTVKQALARDHKQGTSALPGNKTGHFSDTIALAGGVPSRYPISVNDVWVGRMFGVPDEVMSGNQSLHEPMAKYFNKLRDFYNERHKDELPFPYQSWNFQAGAWVDLRNKETGKGSGDAYHQVWDKTLAKLQRAGVSGIKDGKITRQAFMDPRFADALRGTLKPWRDAPKATVELGTKLTDVGKRAHELYEDAIAKGDELSQKEYLSGITTAMYASARGKGHPWERLKKAITGDVTARGDITRIGHPTTDSPFEAGGTFEGTVSPNIRIPLKDMNKEHQEQFNAVAGKHLKQAAMAVSTILGAEQGSEPRDEHTRGHSVFVPTQEQISADHLRGFAGKLKTLGHETSFQRHPNGYQFDVMPKFNPDGSKEGIDEQTLNAAYRDTLAPHYGAGEIVPHDHDSAYTEAENYAEHRRNLVKRIRDEYLKQATDAGVGEKAAAAALRAESPPKDFPGGGKKAWDVYRARHDHLASAEQGFKDLAKRVNDSHADFITRVEGRRAREAAAQARAEAAAAKAARPQKAGGGAIDMGSTPYSTDAQGAPSGTAQRGKDALGLAGSAGGSDAPAPGSGRDFLNQLANDPKTDGMTRLFAAGMAKSGTFTGQDPSKPEPVAKADGGPVDDPNRAPELQGVPEQSPVASPSYIKPIDPDARKLSPAGLYSHAADEVWKQPQLKASPAQFKAMLTKRGVKPDEFKWSGYDQAFAGRDFVSKKEVRDHFVRNLPKIQETVKGGVSSYSGPGDTEDDPAKETKYRDYQLPGGRNYREVVLHLPKKEMSGDAVEKRARELAVENGANYDQLERAKQFRLLGMARKEHDAKQPAYESSHWDEPNPLFHLRMSDRKGSKGEKILHVEELQSDWGQAARDQGIHSPENQATKQKAFEDHVADLKGRAIRQMIAEGHHKDDAIRYVNRQRDPQLLDMLGDDTAKAKYIELMANKAKKGIPPAPYIDSTAKWTDLGLKRVLHEAAKGGYDKVVVTPGEEQAKRFDLRERVREINYSPVAGDLVAHGHGGSFNPVVNEKGVKPEDLHKYIGKEAAQKLMHPDNKLPGVDMHILGGDDLQVGGEGMKGFYDKVVPIALQKLARQHDPEAKVQLHEHPVSGGERREMIARLNKRSSPPVKLHSLDITPRMRASILAGQKGYAAGGRIAERIHDDIYKKARKVVMTAGSYPGSSTP